MRIIFFNRRKIKKFTIINSMNKVAISFFTKILCSRGSGNVVCSSLSMSQILSLIAFGARKKTKKKLETFLHIDYDIIEAYDFFYRYMKWDIENLFMVNKIYIPENIEFKKEFSQRIDSISRNIIKFDPTDTGYHKQSWISKEVHARSYVSLKQQTKNCENKDEATLLLVNNLEFSETWRYPFNGSNTTNHPFYDDYNVRKNVPTMIQVAKLRYSILKKFDATIFELPYASWNTGGHLSMFIVVLNQPEKLDFIVRNLKKINLKKLCSSDCRPVRLYLPKFRVETEITIDNLLRKMKLKELSTLKADFSEISLDNNFFISNFGQKISLKVDERGTNVFNHNQSATRTRKIEDVDDYDDDDDDYYDDNDKPVNIMVNRPFIVLIAICDLILFTARISDPLI